MIQFGEYIYFKWVGSTSTTRYQFLAYPSFSRFVLDPQVKSNSSTRIFMECHECIFSIPNVLRDDKKLLTRTDLITPWPRISWNISCWFFFPVPFFSLERNVKTYAWPSGFTVLRLVNALCCAGLPAQLLKEVVLEAIDMGIIIIGELGSLFYLPEMAASEEGKRGGRHELSGVFLHKAWL